MALTTAETAFITLCFEFTLLPFLTTAFELFDVTFQVTSFEKLHPHAVFQTTDQSMYHHRRR
jgi:hypothetical protein